MEKKKFNYITEILTKKDVELMLDHKDGITLIVSPTGTGKSTFIIEELIKPNFENESYGFGESKYSQFEKKKILVMANRTAVVLKFNEDVEKACDEMGIFNANGVTVASYQKVTDEKMINAIDEADIIICDEAHYFVSDAWNGTTGIIINKILEAVEEKPVIFFTATPQLINKYLNYRGLVYKELDYRNILGFTDRMDFIVSNKDLEQIIKEIPVGEKWMAFVEDNKSKKRQKNWCEKLNEEGYSVEYYHSTWIKEADGTFKGKKDWVMNGKVGLLVGQKKFDTQGAIANKAIDNGIDIIDPD
ncbi:DEAD/DEAH box helicase family protein [Peribacillus butanolivorans]|uniref:DEAD/DEAH box helicase family protein n=1 Tax=Peribacillus butanolivorans TaxID=421767 RepID=UPI003D2E99C1